MLERSIFINALERETAPERSAFLDEACAHDPALRQRVEALLLSHGTAGTFLGQPVPERLAEQLGGLPEPADTQPPQAAGDDDPALTFLAPSDQSGSLGRLGHYEVQEVIGSGGMGIVLRAFDERLHRVVAIKVMSPSLAASAAARKRFTREARAAAAVTHDHIVTIHAVEEADSVPYLVMQYISGLSLQQRLDRSGPLALAEVLRIGMQTAAGLVAAHTQGLIHRDIKPANILLENGVERVKITDFGLARAAADASLTQTGVVAGTPHYMAPEQARGESLDARADLFSLGSVLYAMCTGRAPFRASGSLAVLKRVCDETPTPIRETNPEIPQWLVAIIDKLHAKEPAERFQSASEVTDLLSRHLAHVQHPSVAPLPAVLSPLAHLRRGVRGEGNRRGRQRHWAIAAAVLLCFLLGGLSLTEATGVTQVASTVIRILTPQGTLVVEVDDPGVKVTIEGDGGLVIAGAGAQEVRLKPGSYQVKATKDGKSVKREVVTITRGGKQVVNVSLEPADLAKATPQQPPQTSGEIRRFEGHTDKVWTVAYSPNGRQALTGSQTSLRLWDVATGKELHCLEGKSGSVTEVAFTSDGQLGLASYSDGVLILWDLESGKEVRRCEPHADPLYCVAVSPNDQFAVAGSRGVMILWDLQTGKELRRFHGHKDNVYGVAFSPDGRHIFSGGGSENEAGGYPMGADHTVRWWAVETGKELTAFQGHTLWIESVAVSPDGLSALSASYDGTIRHWDLQTGKQLRFFFHPSGATSVAFSPSGQSFVSGGSAPYHLYLRDLKTGKQIHRFEGHEHKIQSLAFSHDGHTLISGSWDGTLLLWQLPEQVLQPDLSAFALLAGPGVAERKFGTLAEAVQGASDGDTIEVRGNGPFVTQPINLQGRALTIRAGAGYRPVIRSRQEGLAEDAYLFKVGARLVLEGLELHASSRKLHRNIIHTHSAAPLFITNCRLVGEGLTNCIWAGDWPTSLPLTIEIRNSELYTTTGKGVVAVVNANDGMSRLVLDNCVQTGSWALTTAVYQPGSEQVSIRLARNTFVAGGFPVELWAMRGPEVYAHKTGPCIEVDAAENVFDGEMGLFLFEQSHEAVKDAKLLQLPEAKVLLPRLVGWREQQNVYGAETKLLAWRVWTPADPAYLGQLATAAEWDGFWGLNDTKSVVGRPRFQPANIRVKPVDQITPEDFRLRADSPGYRAGKGGKDLGADVDLVGPGPAYERWKTRPEYQQWLKDTEQTK
jgi:WD40 repeat protein